MTVTEELHALLEWLRGELSSLEAAHGIVRQGYDVTRERWTMRGAEIARQWERIGELERDVGAAADALRESARANQAKEERIAELESLVWDMYDSMWTVSESWAYDSYHDRMRELGITESGES